MIVTFPPSLRHEEKMIPPSFYEDHLLERVSLLEFRLKQVTEQLAMAYEFISRQSDLFEKDHLLIASFMEAVSGFDSTFSENLSIELNGILEKKKGEIETENKQKKDLEEILSGHENPNTELFAHLVKEGIKLLEADEEKQGFRTLERASLLSPENIALQIFIAEKLFWADKFEEAKIYLAKVYDLAPQNTKSLLLSGVIFADEYEAEKARKMLSVLASFPKTMVCANYIWGMLASLEENWEEAIVAFKESLDVSETPEIQYLIGCAYYQIRNYPQALEHLEFAVLGDKKFADAFYMISVIYEILNKDNKAEKTRQMALNAKEAGAKSLKYLSKKKPVNLKYALPFVHFRDNKKRLLTNGSLRMTRFFRHLVFDAVN